MEKKIPKGSGIAVKGVGKASQLLTREPMDLLAQKMQNKYHLPKRELFYLDPQHMIYY